jgi:hypothetical protein
VLEDIGLWLALAVATATAGKTVLHPRELTYHLATTVVSPVAYALSVLLGYCVLAGLLDVSMVFRCLSRWVRGGAQEAQPVFRTRSKPSGKCRSPSSFLFISQWLG